MTDDEKALKSEIDHLESKICDKIAFFLEKLMKYTPKGDRGAVSGTLKTLASAVAAMDKIKYDEDTEAGADELEWVSDEFENQEERREEEEFKNSRAGRGRTKLKFD
ncbi:MAG: hypothetical protein LBU36_05405 [Clostridiales bacterium]|nr:hypothetical protein [Clostridiales bacterium]